MDTDGSASRARLVSAEAFLTIPINPLKAGCDASPKHSYIQLSLVVTVIPSSALNRSSATTTSPLLQLLTPSAMT